MDTLQFNFLTDIIKRRSGISLGESKRYLVESRLLPVARDAGHPDIASMATALQKAPDETIISNIIEAITTNETSFFRDNNPFKQFTDSLLPELVKQSGTQIRIWSAACSTGQEPYTLAMLLKENEARLGNKRPEIIATDISQQALEKAKAGQYSQFEIQRGLPVTLMVKYFEQHNENWVIKDSLKDNIRYRQFNLLNNYTGFGQFDIIFCRNVLIYFDDATKKDILRRMAENLKPGGFLLLGAGEAIYDTALPYTPFESLRGIFVRKDSADTKLVNTA